MGEVTEARPYARVSVTELPVGLAGADSRLFISYTYPLNWARRRRSHHIYTNRMTCKRATKQYYYIVTVLTVFVTGKTEYCTISHCVNCN